MLAAYEPVEWRISLAPGARLAGIVALGMHLSHVTGDIAGVRVVTNEQRDHCAALGSAHLYAYEAGADQQRLAEAVERMIGVPVADFQGSYRTAAFDVD